ncbi:hypothetical protein EUTSA_v10015207mg [Eutrema salsugineum]|uniref:Uncharacterized protein n=1 Tax=Eutrema salsugineum TaxID=72664 RepID=V4LFW0_EUTSA|nr:hypothetical protein EUTSA_v10015207mg [Eutrema salsugineum]
MKVYFPGTAAYTCTPIKFKFLMIDISNHNLCRTEAFTIWPPNDNPWLIPNGNGTCNGSRSYAKKLTIHQL